MREKSKPLISICIPTYNRGDYIHRALESSIRQSYENIEIVVADDASTDDTEAVVRRYMAKDKRIKYFKNNPNLGGQKNFFKAIEFSSGEYIQGLCDDDWISENYIEEGVRGFSTYPQIGMVFGRVITLDLNKNNVFNPQRIFISKTKKYSTDKFLKNAYKLQLALFGGFALYRRSDLMDIKKFMFDILESPFYRVAREFGFWGEAIIPLKILSKYQYYFCNTNSAYVLVMHPDSYGGSRGDDPSAHDVFIRAKRSASVKEFWERLYKNELNRFYVHFKLDFVAQEIADTLISFLRGKFINQSCYDINKGVSLMLKGYSLFEKILIIFEVPIVFVSRAVIYFVKLLSKRLENKKKFTAYYPKIFMKVNDDMSGLFIFENKR